MFPFVSFYALCCNTIGLLKASWLLTYLLYTIHQGI